MLKAVTIILAVMVPATATAAGGFPIAETVRQVVGCMAQLGDQTEEHLLTCACRQEVIEAEMTFEVFEQASLQERYRSMPGKRGGLFRDDEISREQLKQLKDVRKQAHALCPAVKRVATPPRPERGN